MGKAKPCGNVWEYTMVNSLRREGRPNSISLLIVGGKVKQIRWYGSNGVAIRDRDYFHPGEDHEFPHDHEWIDGVRGKDHMLPDYENYFYDIGEQNE